MKNKKLNAADIMLILVLVLCAAGIVIRAFRLPLLPSVSDKEYRIQFTAKTDAETLEKITAGTEFKESAGVTLRLLEGYWIKTEDGAPVLYGELVMKGRITESGFESGGKFYHTADVLELEGKDIRLSAEITDFVEKR